MKRTLPSHLLAVLMLGTVSQVGQVILLREFLMVFHGSELSIGLILAAWLAWVGVGSRLGAVLVGRARSHLFLLLLSSVGMLFALPSTILLIRSLRGFFDVLPGAHLSLQDMIISCSLVMAPACLLLGMQFVLLARTWRTADRTEDTGSAVKTYVGEAAGNMIGGILFTFFMVHHLDPLQSAVIVAMSMLTSALLVTRETGADGRGVTATSRRVCVGLLVAAALALPFLGHVDAWAHRIKWGHLMPEHQLVGVYQSKHGAVSVLQREDQYSFFQSGHLVFSTAGPESPTPGLEDQEAVAFAHFSMVQHRQPQSVLLIGGGLRGMIGEIARHPVERIDYVELDQVLTEAALPFVSPTTLQALGDPRVRLIHADGRLFVRTASEKYDVVIADVPDPTTGVLNRYYSREFFQQIEGLLKPNGVFAIGVVSTPGLRGTAVANRNTTIYHTLKSVFPHVLVAGDRFMFFFASSMPGQAVLDVTTLQERYLDRGIEASGFSHHHFEVLLPEAQLERVNWVVRNHGRLPGAHLQGPELAPLSPGTIEMQDRLEQQLPPVDERYFVNSDLAPILYYYTLMFWDDLTRTGDANTLRWLLHVSLWWMIPFFCLPLLLLALALRKTAPRIGAQSGARFAVLLAVFTTGLSTMALQIALLFSFQSVYGFVYELVGLIVAVFMCGLALGSLFTHLRVAHKADTGTLAAVQLWIALLAGLIALVLARAVAVESPSVVFLLFSGLTFVSGLINGVDFPLSAACYMTLTGDPEKSAGTVYGMELFGACVGAALASVVVAPVLGIIACCILAGLANGTAFVVLRICGRSHSCLKKAHPAAN